jgi:hypothetical protein
MRTESSLFFAFCVTFCLMFYANIASANDTITEITPQGLKFRTENNISIEREDLYISLNKIEVSYEFRNNSDRDITAEIAFPIPPYWGLAVANIAFGHYPLSFDDFEVEANGKRVDRKKEVHAYTKGEAPRDITDILRNMNISIEDFAGFGSSSFPVGRNAIKDLSMKNKSELLKLGAIDSDDVPCWVVDMKFHWTQTFPANSVVRIRHRYTPYFGGDGDYFQRWQGNAEGEINPEMVKESCLDGKTKLSLEKKALTKVNETGKMGHLNYLWVSYILTTGNNWKGPIKEFNLTLEKPEGSILSLCFDDKIVKTSSTRFETHIDNFVPKRDLKVYFITLVF